MEISSGSIFKTNFYKENMELNLIKFNNVNNNSRYNKVKNNMRGNFASNDVSFKGNFFTKTTKGISDVTYTNINLISAKVDEILGDKFFTTTLQKSGLEVSNNSIVFKEKNVFQEIASTIAYPFLKLPVDLINSLLRGLKKIPVTKGIATKISNFPPLARRAAQLEREKNYECMKALLARFSSNKGVTRTFAEGEKFSQFSADNCKTTIYDLDSCFEIFKDRAATDIVDLAKNYNSRDERTLNRLVTSFVSALYSGRDFYNISMLQKDDKKEAKKAEKARLKQEFTRMGMSAAMTFVSLGALSKYTKNNILLNSLVIAGSALISEVGSRILSNTPLKPLSPKEAKEYLEREKQQKSYYDFSIKDNTDKIFAKFNTNNPPSFKGVIDENNFKDFIMKDNKISSQVSLKDEADNKDNKIEDKIENKAQEKTKSKKTSIPKLLLGLFGTASLFYLAKKGLTGEYAKKIDYRKIYNENSKHIEMFAEKQGVAYAGELKEIIEKANAKQESNPVYKFFKALSDLGENIDYKKTVVSADAIENRLKELEKLPEGKEISSLFAEYVRQARAIEAKATDNTIIIFTKRELPAGLRRGVNKLVTTVYSILSMPGEIIDAAINKIFFEDSDKAIKKIVDSGKDFIPVEEKTRKGLSQLCQFIFENQEEGKKINSLFKKFKKNQRNDVEIINAIKENTRNFEIGADTGALANMSRTMVTAITSYFFVNDYRNKVLIESAGEDVEKANEEGRERVAHKLSNFVINGTLMNIFNSVFKRALNSSLLGATLVAASTELTNEFMVRKSICQPVRHMKSRQDIIDYEKQQENRKGVVGAWTKIFRKITGKKNLSEKVAAEENKK